MKVALAFGFLCIATLLPVPVEACSLERDGCTKLIEAAAPICMAKVSCADLVDAIDRAERVFMSCVNGQVVSIAEVDALLSAFGSPLAFQCCVGNALHQGL
jgi:hypothetical protein